MPYISVEWQVSLPSSGNNCETCGPSWDWVQVEAEVLDGRVEWYATYSTGCYGGTSGATFEEVLDVINAAIGDYGRLLEAATVRELEGLRRSVQLFNSQGWAYL